MQVRPEHARTAVNLKAKGNSLGSGVQRSPQKAGVLSHLSRPGSACARRAQAVGETLLCVGISVSPETFLAAGMETLWLRGEGEGC